MYTCTYWEIIYQSSIQPQKSMNIFEKLSTTGINDLIQEYKVSSPACQAKFPNDIDTKEYSL